jgi:hypothetical protein
MAGPYALGVLRCALQMGSGLGDRGSPRLLRRFAFGNDSCSIVGAAARNTLKAFNDLPSRRFGNVPCQDPP